MTNAGGQVFVPQGQGFAAREDGGERIVDLVHDAGRQLADRGKLFALREALLRLPPGGHVFADRDDV